MTDIQTPPEFPSNSLGKRGAQHMDLRPAQPAAPPPKKEVARVTTGPVIKKKKPLIDRAAELFWGEDANTVGKYLVQDVLIPSAKNLVYDMIHTGVEMLLWGQTKKTLPGVRPGTGPTNYNGIYRTNERKEVLRSRSVYDVRPCVMTTSQEAEGVLTKLIEMIDIYKVASVADYYQAVGVSTDFTDHDWGWANLSDARVKRDREGYVLMLPRPVPLER